MLSNQVKEYTAQTLGQAKGLTCHVYSTKLDKNGKLVLRIQLSKVSKMENHTYLKHVVGKRLLYVKKAHNSISNIPGWFAGCGMKL
jgi:hypothetical protein